MSRKQQIMAIFFTLIVGSFAMNGELTIGEGQVTADDETTYIPLATVGIQEDTKKHSLPRKMLQIEPQHTAAIVPIDLAEQIEQQHATEETAPLFADEEFGMFDEEDEEKLWDFVIRSTGPFTVDSLGGESSLRRRR